MHAFRSNPALVLSLLLAACGGSSSGAGGSAGTGGGAGDDCAVPSLGGAPTAVTTTSGTAFPSTAAAGGTITAGTYFLTSVDVYVGGHGHSYSRAVLVLAPDASELKIAQGDGTNIFAKYTVSGSTMSFEGICGLAGGDSQPFTATGTTFVVYDAKNGRVDTWTKQ